MARPRVAIISTVSRPNSHADVIATRLIKGYEFQGARVEPRVEVVSLYLEQTPDNDMGVAIVDAHNIPRFPTVAEAITCGGRGVNVDGVVIIGEHGEYESNEFEQKLYPRRRLFDAAVGTMVGAGRTVPVFNDKHLSWAFSDARAMYDTAQRLGIPFLAGSTVPLAWRLPRGTEWPLGEPMTEIVAVGYGPVESYGFHILEGLQVHAERRAGGEQGVVAVQAFRGEDALQAVRDGTVNADLLDAALGAFHLDPAEHEQAKLSVQEMFVVEYADGLRAAAVNCGGVITNFSAAAVGPNHEMACQMPLQGFPFGHFIYLVRQIESLVLNGVAPYPIERTLLTTGILDAAMHSRQADGTRLSTPELAIAYQPAPSVPDTAVFDPVPEPTANVTES
jgi:hypothetical protein